MSLNRQDSIIGALYEAQKIAFAPFVFQATVVARRRGLFDALLKHDAGAGEAELARETGLTSYAVGLLADVLTAAGVIKRGEDSRLRLTKTGECLALDAMTQVNLDFSADVCYRGLSHLDEALETGRAAGLKELGDWETIYPALSHLPEPARTSWFAFDHYYSDRYFAELAQQIARDFAPKTLFDVGGNTGKFAFECLKVMPETEVCVIDLPEQCALAHANEALAAYAERFSTASVNWLDPAAIPHTDKRADIVWMSQFLDCFSPEEAISILKRAQELLADNGRIVVLECLTDAQQWPAAQLSLSAASLYFTTMANGNSRFFRKADLEDILDRAGLAVESTHPGCGVSHSLYVCTPTSRRGSR